MPISQRFVFIPLLATLGLGLSGMVAAVAVVWPHRAKSLAAHQPSGRGTTGPRAVVDELIYDAGAIESGAEFQHIFVIRNKGGAPLQLTEGRKTCKCLVIEVPKSPIPPGGQAEIHVKPNDAAMAEEMKAGPFRRAVEILTNDPEQAAISLKLQATVQHRVVATPSSLTLSIDSSKPSSQQKRSAETLVYSQRWDAFELSVVEKSFEGVEWQIEPAAEKALKSVEALSGYRVLVTMPPNMSDGRFAEWIELAAKRAGGDAPSKSLRVEIQGRVEGRLTFHSPKIVGGNLLRLGTLQQGERAHENLIMKVNDEVRSLQVNKIEAEPAFLRARLSPCGGDAPSVGLYRIEVEIPGDAPSCAFSGQRPGVVRLKTDHPRLPIIELKVDFVVTIGSSSRSLIGN